MKHIPLLLLIIFLPFYSYGQNDYFATDSTFSSSVKLISGRDIVNSQVCQIEKNGTVIEYSPYEVTEYGFKNGRVYIAKEIELAGSPKRVFLERLNEGKLSLYYYKGKEAELFFIEKDSTSFVELLKRDAQNQDYLAHLASYTGDCENVADARKLVSYNKKSMSRFITRYNRCELKPFPHFKYGVLAGYESAQLILLNRALYPDGLIDINLYDEEYFKNNYDGGCSVGLFIDNPILASDYSIHAELLFSKHTYSYKNTFDNKGVGFKASLSSLKVPVLVRYAYPSNKIRPFINAGLVGTYHINNQSLLYKTEITENNQVEKMPDNKRPLMSDILFGYSVGGGLEFKLNYKNALFLEVRYDNQYNTEDNMFLRTSAFNLFTGISF